MEEKGELAFVTEAQSTGKILTVSLTELVVGREGKHACMHRHFGSMEISPFSSSFLSRLIMAKVKGKCLFCSQRYADTKRERYLIRKFLPRKRKKEIN